MDSGKQIQEAGKDAPPAPPAAAEQAEGGSRDPKSRQSIALVVVGGVIGALIGGLLWGLPAMTTGNRLIWMAIPVGVIVGLFVRLLGRGAEPSVGCMAVIFTALGVVIGNFFFFAYKAGQVLEITGFEALGRINAFDVATMLEAGFDPKYNITKSTDLIFYGIAVVVAFFLAFWRFSRPPS